MSDTPNRTPKITWDGKTWHVSLPVEQGKVLDAKWDPGLTYVVRIRERGTKEWSFGFETPVTGCKFVGLKPDTEYEVQVRSKTSAGEGEPSYVTTQTNPGGADNVLAFPKLPKR